jgi:hypothetical protein
MDGWVKLEVSYETTTVEAMVVGSGWLCLPRYRVMSTDKSSQHLCTYLQKIKRTCIKI